MIYPTSDTFKTEVLEEKLPIILDFWAEWCAPCRAMAPIFEKVAPEYEGRMKFGKVNVDEYGDLAQQSHVSSIPCLIVFYQGQEVDRIIGLMREPDFKSRLDQILSGLKD